MSEAVAYLVESIPQGMDDLRDTRGVRDTAEVLVRLTRRARKSIDLTAMYWALLAEPGSERWNPGPGRELYEALDAAASRGVRIRILQSRPTEPGEAEALRKKHPDRVELFDVRMFDWYAGGIMHQKLWVFDRRDLYLGAANMDWKSLTQVKELGVAVENHSGLADDLTGYFEVYLRLAGLDPSPLQKVWDDEFEIFRTLPPWSAKAPEERRVPSPLESADPGPVHNAERPLVTHLDGQEGRVFISGSPPEMCTGGRTPDADTVVYTVRDARRTVDISVMDFAPAFLYHLGYGTRPERETPWPSAVWWPTLWHPLVAACLSRNLAVRLLVSRWAHTDPAILEFLAALRQTIGSGLGPPGSGAGSFEIRLFEVPGWDRTTGSDPEWPPMSRVNHTKYMVTDRRANIGTSNLVGTYFTETAGTSFNTDHPGIVARLQAVFDRDWSSPYARPFDPTDGS